MPTADDAATNRAACGLAKRDARRRPARRRDVHRLFDADAVITIHDLSETEEPCETVVRSGW